MAISFKSKNYYYNKKTVIDYFQFDANWRSNFKKYSGNKQNTETAAATTRTIKTTNTTKII